MKKATLFDLKEGDDLKTIHREDEILPVVVGQTIYIDQDLLKPLGISLTMYVVREVKLVFLNDSKQGRIIWQRVTVDPWDVVHPTK